MRRPVTLGTLSEKRGIGAVRVTLADSKDGGLEAEAHPKFTIMVSSVGTQERGRRDSEYRSVGCVRFAAFRDMWAEVEQLCVDVGFEPPAMESPLPRTYKRQSIGVKLTTDQLIERSRDLTGWLSEVLELPLPLRALEVRKCGSSFRVRTSDDIRIRPHHARKPITFHQIIFHHTNRPSRVSSNSMAPHCMDSWPVG